MSKITPIATARMSDGMLEVLSIVENAQLDVEVTHIFNGKRHTTIVREDARGDRYFRAHGQRVYLADLRKVRILN